MADYITTYTGIHMIPSEPEPEDFRIEDIAGYACIFETALSKNHSAF